MHWTKAIAGSAVLMLGAALAAGGASAAAQTTTQKGAGAQDWWRNAVILEIYPRSFQDTNGDGIGDLNGITRRLDYLKELGVDAIWLTPVYPSPQVDFGYDISDYEAIDPQYGTMADFDRLMAEAGKRHIRVVMDMVMNHTSDQHKWFLESRSSRTNPYRDWYMWRDGKMVDGKMSPPNNWQSDMGHSAWQWDEKTGQYYYHKFYSEQPDLNWDNPKVMAAFNEIVRFWLKKGVAGFRFDAITTLFEDPSLADEPYVLDKDGKPVIDAYGEKATDQSKTDNLPGVHTVMAQVRGVFDEASTPAWPGTRVMIGETYLPSIAELAKQYGTKEKPEFQLPMDTQLAFINKLDIAQFRTKLNEIETQVGSNVPLLLFDNHDNPRIDARYSDGLHDTEIGRMLAAILFLSRGTSLFYYGDEIGMKTTPPTRKEDVKDPMGVTGWPKEKGRDGERTPMQWDATANAGFSKGTPWLPVPPNYTAISVAAEKGEKDSLLSWYKELIRLKKVVPALASGSFTMLDAENPKALSWVRQAGGTPAVVVTVSFSIDPQTVSVTVPGTAGKLKTLVKSPGGTEPESAAKIPLGSFGVYVGELK